MPKEGNTAAKEVERTEEEVPLEVEDTGEDAPEPANEEEARGADLEEGQEAEGDEGVPASRTAEGGGHAGAGSPRRLLFKAPDHLVGRTYAGREVRDIYAGDILYREADLIADAVDLEARTVSVAFSSTTPVSRWWADEVLDHSPGAVRLDRLKNGAPVLVNHIVGDHVGVVEGETVRIDADEMGRAVLRFGNSPRAGEILQDIADGIRRHVSVGYRVWEVTTVTPEPEGREEVTVTDWEPMEISIASIPADTTVGVGRSIEIEPPVVERNHENHQEDGNMPNEIKDDVLAKERQRQKNIRELGDKFEARDLANEFIDGGRSEEEFQKALLERMATPTTLEEVQDRARLDMPKRDLQKYSMFRAIEAMITNDWSKAGLEREAHLQLQERQDSQARGFLVPQDVLEFRDVEKGGTATGAALVGTEHLAGSYIDALRARSVLAANGAKILDGLTGDLAIPRLATGATFFIVDEGGTLTAVDLSWLAVTLSPYTIGTKVPITRKMLKQSSPAVEALVRSDIAKGMALRVDYYGLRGTGSGEPRGILNTPNVGAVVGGTDGAEVTHSHIVDMETVVAAEDADAGSLVYIVHPTMRGHLKTKEKATGTAVFVWGNGGELNGYKAATTTQLPTGLTKGNSSDCMASVFGNISDVMIGLWGGLDLVLDTITRDDGGHILKAYQDMDSAVRHGESFSVMMDGRAN